MLANVGFGFGLGMLIGFAFGAIYWFIFKLREEDLIRKAISEAMDNKDDEE